MATWGSPSPLITQRSSGKNQPTFYRNEGGNLSRTTALRGVTRDTRCSHPVIPGDLCGRLLSRISSALLPGTWLLSLRPSVSSLLVWLWCNWRPQEPMNIRHSAHPLLTLLPPPEWPRSWSTVVGAEGQQEKGSWGLWGWPLLNTGFRIHPWGPVPLFRCLWDSWDVVLYIQVFPKASRAQSGALGGGRLGLGCGITSREV